MKQILIFSGAGLSAESGIATFRDADGLWEGNDPNIVSNINAFFSNKEIVFDFYNKYRAKLADAQPNAAHIGIAELQKTYGSENVQIFTQNVDDLLERAGCEHVNHVHGFLPYMMCLNEKCGHAWDVGYTSVSHDASCPKCAMQNIKPAVVFFGEGAPGYENLYKTFKHSRDDLIIVIGTSGEVIPLSYITGNRYSTNRSKTVLNNLEYNPLGYVDKKLFDICLFKPATEAWSRIREIADEFMTS